MFDKVSSLAVPPAPPRARRRDDPEDERIALRCNRKELQLLDSFVVTGEFGSRSELMREALRAFLRARTAPSVATPLARDPSTLTEVIVRLRADEVERLTAYGEVVGNGQPLPDLIATLVRRGEAEAKVSELVERARNAIRESRDQRERLSGLASTGRDLERKGVVGR